MQRPRTVAGDFSTQFAATASAAPVLPFDAWRITGIGSDSACRISWVTGHMEMGSGYGVYQALRLLQGFSRRPIADYRTRGRV